LSVSIGKLTRDKLVIYRNLERFDAAEIRDGYPEHTLLWDLDNRVLFRCFEGICDGDASDCVDEVALEKTVLQRQRRVDYASFGRAKPQEWNTTLHNVVQVYLKSYLPISEYTGDQSELDGTKGHELCRERLGRGKNEPKMGLLTSVELDQALTPNNDREMRC
jgi:hypothetical protein